MFKNVEISISNVDVDFAGVVLINFFDLIDVN